MAHVVGHSEIEDYLDPLGTNMAGTTIPAALGNDPWNVWASQDDDTQSWGPYGAPSIWGTPTDDVLSTFAKRPQALWRAAQMQQLGSKALIPQFQRTIGQGFTPAYGGYLMASPEGTGGERGTFAQYLGAGGGPEARRLAAMTDWATAVEASRRDNPTYTPAAGAPALTQAQMDRSLAIPGALSNENARANTIAMAQAGMGGGGGYMGQARQRALGNLYDIYAARAEAVGQPTSGFLAYLGDQMGTASPYISTPQ